MHCLQHQPAPRFRDRDATVRISSHYGDRQPVFQRPRDKLRDNRRRRAQEILKQQAAESAERDRVETLYVGAGLSLFGLAVLVFFLDFLFYVGFWRCFTPLASVFGGYFYYSLSAEPPAAKKA